MVILFDLDGTLIDSTEAILESFHHALEVLGADQSVSDATICAQIGHPLEVMFAHVGIADPTPYVAAYKEHYRTIATRKTTLLDRAREAIEWASTFASLGIVTTKTGRYSREIMEHFGVMHYFEVLIGREDVTHPKPHAEPILRALESFAPQEAWMIGDTWMDLASAQSAHIHAIGVLSGYDSHEALEPYTSYIVRDAYEAIEMIQKWSKE